MKAQLLVALLVAAHACAAAPLFAVESDDLAREAAAAAKEGKRLAVMIEREDCPYCERMKRNVFPAAAAKRQFGAWFRTVTVNADRDTNLVAPDGTRSTPAAFAARLRLVGTPAFVFVDAAGRVETRYQGALQDAADLNALGAYVREGGYESLPFPAWREQQKAHRRSTAVPVVEGDICTTRRHGA